MVCDVLYGVYIRISIFYNLTAFRDYVCTLIRECADDLLFSHKKFFLLVPGLLYLVKPFTVSANFVTNQFTKNILYCYPAQYKLVQRSAHAAVLYRGRTGYGTCGWPLLLLVGTMIE